MRPYRWLRKLPSSRDRGLVIATMVCLAIQFLRRRRESNPTSALKTLNLLILRMPAFQRMPPFPNLPYKSRTKISQNSRTSKPLLRSPNTPKCSPTFIHRLCSSWCQSELSSVGESADTVCGLPRPTIRYRPYAHLEAWERSPLGRSPNFGDACWRDSNDCGGIPQVSEEPNYIEGSRSQRNGW